MRLRVFVIVVLSLDAALSQKTLPPFRHISNNVQSGPLEILDENTIKIRELYYDGKSNETHFWVGKGEPSSNGTRVPFVNGTGGTLPPFNNANFTLTLPKTLTIQNIDYISIWSEFFKMSLGHVFTNERWIEGKNGMGMIVPKTIGPLKLTQKGVSSSDVKILDERQILIPNFSYDGSGYSVSFVVRNSKDSNQEKILMFDTNSTVLSPKSKEDVTVFLPPNSSFIDFDYLTIWDTQSKSSYGYVSFKDISSNIEKYVGVTYDGFENSEYGLKSGPIIAAGSNTLYITNFKYRGWGNERFWLGTEISSPRKGFLLENQFGFNKSIVDDASGISFYLTLPLEKLKAGEMVYFGIYDQNSNGIVDNIRFRNDMKMTPAKITEDGKRIIRFPKCCPPGQTIEKGGCFKNNLILDTSIPVHFANATHLNDVPLNPDRLIFVPFHNNLSCPKYYLDNDDIADTFLLLITGKLLYPFEKKQFDQEEFCLDTINDDGDVLHTAFICTTRAIAGEWMRIGICICIFFSAICLLLTAVIFFVVTDTDDMRGASVAGFSGCMGIAFVCLFFTQLGLQSETACNAFGFIFQFFIVSSLIWLDALCFEMLYYIKYYNDDAILGTYKKRLMWYLGLSIVIPMIFVIISLASGLSVGLFNVNLDKNCFFNVSKMKWMLYTPILVTLIISIVLTVWNYQLFYRTNTRRASGERNRRDFWEFTKADMKTRLMLCVFLVAFTSICWIFEIVTYAFDSSWEPLDFLHALQGVFTMTIVLSTGNIWKKLLNRLKSSNRSRSERSNVSALEPINNNADSAS